MDRRLLTETSSVFPTQGCLRELVGLSFCVSFYFILFLNVFLNYS